MRRLLLASTFALAFTSFNAFAADVTCAPVAIKSQNKEIILRGPDEPRSSKVYFFKNATAQSIWIDHPVEHASASAGWSSYVRAGNFSALLVNRKNFAISCAVIKPGKVEMLDCEKAVSVCMVKQVIMTSNRKGTYWLAEDKSWADLITTLAKRGVQVK